MTLRSATEDDRDAVLSLGVAEETAWMGEPESTLQEIGEWIDEEGGIGQGVVAVDEHAAVRGFAAPGRHQALFLADPTLTDALADELLPWLREQREAAPLMTFAGDDARVRAFERHGLRHRRSSFSLLRPADAGPVPAAAFPVGIDVAPYRLGEADEAVHRLIYVEAAWASIAGHVERDLDGWREKDRSCTSMFLARRGDRPVGWVAGRLLESGRGYVNTLAVARDERGRGLGRALLLQAFDDLQRAGAGELTLGVEAANETAIGLYRSIGMEVEREWRIYSA